MIRIRLFAGDPLDVEKRSVNLANASDRRRILGGASTQTSNLALWFMPKSWHHGKALAQCISRRFSAQSAARLTAPYNILFCGSDHFSVTVLEALLARRAG